MLLKEIAIPHVDVPVDKGSVAIYGLTLEHITDLLATHAKEISDIFNGKADPVNLVSEAPLLAAKVIALACKEPDAVDVARNLPLGTQIKLLESVWDLTLPDAEALGKLLSRLELQFNLPSPEPKDSALSGPQTKDGSGS